MRLPRQHIQPKTQAQTMKHTNTVFHDLLQQISKPLFDKAVTRHRGDYRVRTLSCWTQFVALLYGQLTHRQSLRDVEMAFNSHRTTIITSVRNVLAVRRWQMPMRHALLGSTKKCFITYWAR